MIIVNLIMAIYVLFRFTLAINGNTETVPDRLSLVRAMTVYVLKQIIGPTAVGFSLYNRDERNIHYIEYWTYAVVGGLLAFWWRWSFVKWYEQLKKGNYVSTNNETQVSDISVLENAE